MSGPMELGNATVPMGKTQGLTKVQYTKGPVLLKASHTIRVKKESVAPSESLINPDGLGCF